MDKWEARVMTPEQKQRIDNMNYEQMLTVWRFGDTGDSLFIGDVGTYFHDELFRRKKLLPHDEVVSISKRIGWNVNTRGIEKDDY